MRIPPNLSINNKLFLKILGILLGRLVEAIQCYDRLIELNPKNTITFNNKGFA